MLEHFRRALSGFHLQMREGRPQKRSDADLLVRILEHLGASGVHVLTVAMTPVEGPAASRAPVPKRPKRGAAEGEPRQNFSGDPADGDRRNRRCRNRERERDERRGAERGAGGAQDEIAKRRFRGSDFNEAERYKAVSRGKPAGDEQVHRGNARSGQAGEKIVSVLMQGDGPDARDESQQPRRERRGGHPGALRFAQVQQIPET
ncbi:MAG: hypothetical protein COR54_07030 [Elusimicrobia bacterium CG22_combo_CG10-13_8_21_14_all_63_91]|nr:MAG: hypothetical protein COR54_07030 [Elusimicrobia bacterium CG22_combo_CG10-13_8_21_14_all_63_91]